MSTAAPDLAGGSRDGRGVDERPQPPRPGRSLPVLGLFVLASFYTLYLGRAFFLPLVLAGLLSFLLRPPVRFLRRRRIPEPVGAALILVLLIAAVLGALYQLSGPAARWGREVPERLREAERTLREIRRPVEQMREATEKVEELTDLDGDRTPEPTVQVQQPKLGDLLIDRAMSISVATFTVVFLLYFLLSAGDLFLRKLVRVLPRLGDRKRAVEIARRIETDVSTYLFTVTLINAALGIAVGLALSLAGMPNPALWGCMAAVFNFVPYVGPVIGGGVLFVAALTSFDAVGPAVGIVAIFGALTSLEGYLITPVTLGRRLTLNPVVIFVGVIFWGWIWGVAGAVLAVPILATVKIFCDNIDSLAPLGEFLGS